MSFGHKGATSGHFQHVKSIMTDCDQDTLLIAVEQEGAACHTEPTNVSLRKFMMTITQIGVAIKKHFI